MSKTVTNINAYDFLDWLCKKKVDTVSVEEVKDHIDHMRKIREKEQDFQDLKQLIKSNGNELPHLLDWETKKEILEDIQEKDFGLFQWFDNWIAVGVRFVDERHIGLMRLEDEYSGRTHIPVTRDGLADWHLTRKNINFYNFTAMCRFIAKKEKAQ